MKAARQGFWRRHEFWVAVMLLVGLGFTIFLVADEGAATIFGMLARGGWSLLLLLPVHVLVISLDATSWLWLLQGQKNARLSLLVWLALLREAINALLPVARVGGEIVGARMLARAGVPGYVAGASIMVEVSLTLLSQFLFTLVGFVILVYAVGDRHLQDVVLLFMLSVLPLLGAFFWLQKRWGLFYLLQQGLKRVMGGKDWLLLLGEPRQLDQEIRRIYGRRWGLLWANFWQLGSLFAGAVEVWLTFVLLGHPVPIWAAVLMESLGQALRSLAFFMPAGLGVQEGGFVLFGSAIGVGPDLALAFSLVRRFRELALGVPLLLYWYMSEGHHVRMEWQKNRSSREGVV